ncbi:MAG: FprA family A-type flavoprotein [Candidatus Cryptobacteroides sp.]
MKLTEFIRYVGVNDNRRLLFENQWPLPYGVAYNSYLVVDEKIALIDTAAAAFGEEFLRNIREEIGDKKVDYLIVNHMEPDHSALISLVRSAYPDIEIVTNAKAVPMIAGFQGVDANIRVIKEGESLSLGKTGLVFRMTPMVHWPETMMTYFPEENTLFSGDAFGCFGALEDSNIDGFAKYRDEMVRYYSCIVGKYGQTVQSALGKLAGIPLDRICSTHGPVWESELGQVVSLYDRLSRYETRRGVCIVYGSMYGNTADAAKAIYDECVSRGVPCALHDAVAEDASFIYKDVFEYDTLVMGSPTYNNDIFPAVRNILHGVCARMVKAHRFASFGSFSWAGGSVKLMNQKASEAGLEIVSDGMPFKCSFKTAMPDVKSFVDSITHYKPLA